MWNLHEPSVLQHLDFFSACDEFPGGLCLVGQVENLRTG
jgi:hypothetical protein